MCFRFKVVPYPPLAAGSRTVKLAILAGRIYTTQLLKVQSCKLHNKKYMIDPTQITNNETFAFIVVPVFTFLSCKGLFINRRDNRNC